MHRSFYALEQFTIADLSIKSIEKLKNHSIPFNENLTARNLINGYDNQIMLSLVEMSQS